MLLHLYVCECIFERISEFSKALFCHQWVSGDLAALELLHAALPCSLSYAGECLRGLPQPLAACEPCRQLRACSIVSREQQKLSPLFFTNKTKCLLPVTHQHTPVSLHQLPAMHCTHHPPTVPPNPLRYSLKAEL